jgi:catechol-2,3-dioxygenase
MNNSNHYVKGLGEVSIRVRDLDAMHKFCDEVVGLEVLRRARALCSSKSPKTMTFGEQYDR